MRRIHKRSREEYKVAPGLAEEPPLLQEGVEGRTVGVELTGPVLGAGWAGQSKPSVSVTYRRSALHG